MPGLVIMKTTRRSALMIAALGGHKDIVERLAQAGADVQDHENGPC